MKLRARRAPIRRSTAAITSAILCLCLASAQTPSISERDHAQAEMRELFGKVERRLREIDRLLSDAGAGDTAALSGAKKSGIDELLKTSQARQREVLEGIDRILELARENQSRSSSGSGSPSGEPQSGGKSPLDKQGDQESQREQTPSTPKPSGSKKGEKPGSQNQDGSQPKPDKPDGKDGDPRDPRASPKQDPKNKPGQAPPGQATDAASKGDGGKDRWGDLPVKVRDVFRAEGGSDMPVQYREWIDSYYRRLNKKP